MRLVNISLPALLASAFLLALAVPNPAQAQTPSAPVGIFDGHGDVGTVLHPGSVDYDPSAKTYTVSGSGDNVWAKEDDFQFVWKKVSGDVSLTADIAFLGKGVEEHRKAMLMVRQSLDPDSPYADIAAHGVGLTSLQARAAQGDATHEVQANQNGPKHLRLVKRGSTFYMSVAMEPGGDLQFAGTEMRVPLAEPFYVGIGVCSHNKDVTEKAVFSNVELSPLRPVGNRKPDLFSSIETITVSSTDRHVTMTAPARLEAPTWTRDGKTLIFVNNGRLQRVAEPGGTPEMADTGAIPHAGSTHAVSPDGAQLAFNDDAKGRSTIYIEPLAGGTPRPVAPGRAPAWSPDGQTLLFTAPGDRKGQTDIFTIPSNGGMPTQLTKTGMEDFAEYTPDGKTIYFQSARTGTVQIWRMNPGGGQEMVTAEDSNNACPHISPNGRLLAFLSYDKDVKGIPVDQPVTLKVMTLIPAPGRGARGAAPAAPSGPPDIDQLRRSIAVLANLTGGQGTLDAPCWAPNSARLAFVSYHLLPHAPAAAAR